MTSRRRATKPRRGAARRLAPIHSWPAAAHNDTNITRVLGDRRGFSDDLQLHVFPNSCMNMRPPGARPSAEPLVSAASQCGPERPTVGVDRY
jgi:hypothetical protein